MISYTNLAERPDLVEAMWAVPSPWPTFMQQDLISRITYGRLPLDFPELQVVALDGDHMVGRVNAVPYAWSGRDEDLPETGWDAALARAFLSGPRATTTTACLIEARLDPTTRGRGLGGDLVVAARENARALGYADLLAPIRPTAKHLEPEAGIEEYVFRTRPDGSPYDPWLRVHLRLGGRLVKVCPAAMTIVGSLAQWRTWTGLPFATSGPSLVEEALNPVLVSVENDHAVYVEPNVWIAHRTDQR